MFIAVFKNAFFNRSIAPLEYESSSRVPTSAKIPICTFEGVEVDSVNTVTPEVSLVDL